MFYNPKLPKISKVLQMPQDLNSVRDYKSFTRVQKHKNVKFLILKTNYGNFEKNTKVVFRMPFGPFPVNQIQL